MSTYTNLGWSSWRFGAIALTVLSLFASVAIPSSASASDCRWVFCGTITNATDSRYTIQIGADWSESRGRPTGAISYLYPGENSHDRIKDVDGYLLVNGVCAWFYGSGGTTQAKNYLRGDSKWHKIGDDFNYTLHTYRC